MEPRNLHFNKPSRWLWCTMSKFEKQRCRVCHGSWPRFPPSGQQYFRAHSLKLWGFGSCQLLAESFSWRESPSPRSNFLSGVSCIPDWAMEVRRGHPKSWPPFLNLGHLWRSIPVQSSPWKPLRTLAWLCPCSAPPSTRAWWSCCFTAQPNKLPACKSPFPSLFPGQPN